MTKRARKSVVLCAAVFLIFLTAGSQRGFIAGSQTGAPGFPDRSRPMAAASLLAWNTFLGGTGTSAIDISVNTAGLAVGLAAGNSTGTVSIADPNAVNSPRTITVTLVIVAPALVSVPFGEFATSLDGTAGITGAIPVTGWVLTPMPKTVPKDGSTIDVHVDSVKVGTLSTPPNVYDQYRVDVATAFPGLNNSSGPVGAFYLDTTKYTNGVHTIYWVAADDQGAADGIGSRYFNILNTGGSEPFANLGHCEPLGVAIRLGEPSRALRGISSAFATVEEILSIPLSFSPLSFKRGFNRDALPEILNPDNYGTYYIDIKEVELLRISLNLDQAVEDNPPLSNNSTVIASDRRERGDLTFGKIRYSGYLLVGGELRALPVGSTLTAETGPFSWLPGQGFLGAYDLLFVRDNGEGIKYRIPVRIIIRPRV